MTIVSETRLRIMDPGEELENEEEEETGTHVPSTPEPSTPLKNSYTYHSPTPGGEGPYILGIDEAGRGPVLGPLVYGVAYCLVSFRNQLEELGFAVHKLYQVDATVMLIKDVLDKGIRLSEVYVDALGTTSTYQAYLSSQFPGIAFTVESKADFKYKIVGAASVAAKVTRDACLEDWTFEELEYKSPDVTLGSGYPSDPKTQHWLKASLDPTFGFPKVARFSWTTVKLLLEKQGHAVQWIDEGQESLIKAFESAQGLDKDRCGLTRGLGIRSIATL
ncbi:hypothetical protein HHX47_DHR2000821 [Lentinula edodes]|nr:hypothetical protein HHX47_DHR2000821 [Lentinula edodes]